jgi:acyl carrier protein
MERLLEILNEIAPDVDFAEEKALIDDKILTSIDIITLVAEISDEFGVDIPPEELLPENFNSAEALWAMIERLDEE